RCWASSSMISVSRTGSSFRSANRFLISSFQLVIATFTASRSFNSGYAIDRGDKLFPAAALRGQNLLAITREPIVTPPALPRLLNPAPLNPSAFLEPVKQRIKRGDVESQHAIRSRVDELADFVTVAGAHFHQGEDQQLGASLLQLPLEHR